MTRPGFLLGRTDPASDPKGVLVVDALDESARHLHDAKLAALGRSSSNVFEETAMVGELEAGQLDAGFFYAVEIRAARLPSVPLTGVTLSGQFTVAVLNHAPHPSAARAFVAFLESRTGEHLLAANGLRPVATALRAARAP